MMLTHGWQRWIVLFIYKRKCVCFYYGKMMCPIHESNVVRAGYRKPEVMEPLGFQGGTTSADAFFGSYANVPADGMGLAETTHTFPGRRG